MGNINGNRKTGAERGESDIVRQKTLKSPINCTGIALHTGKKVSMTLRPAEADSGIVFRRTDLAGNGAVVDACWRNVVDTRLCTSLGDANGVIVGTVEHLMSALAGCGIDNAEIEISGPEVPVMDGSAAPFVFLIECAGVVEQDAPRRVIRILRPVGVRDGEASASLVPADSFGLDFEIRFAGTAVAHQAITVGIENGTFKKELSRARTFGFLHEVERLWAAGLARGGSLDNAVVVSGEKVLNEEGLRFDNEFVRHKVLDAIGDLYLAGAPLVGHFKGSCSGHATNNKLLRALFADRKAWCFDVMRQGDLAAPQELRQAV
ncbi:MAG: UDP-3-O-acyl-N-acetylglucosamine deacetylase [Hyphomicrobiales bacterium]|nr:UDP-3-O-acyl-N-acetylglucosamine deacetylase [Hyphomicrobiales bacterium]MCP5371219.1 UDP-3-O-acyl-N-acetylglucosamine deacetylase [Hyphomicrobiales bacterium]